MDVDAERFALQLDAIEQRKTSCADAMKRSMKEALEILGRDSALELEYPREELRAWHVQVKTRRRPDGPRGKFSQPPVKRGNSSTAPVKRGRLRRNIAASDSSDDEGGHRRAIKRKTGHDPDQLAKGSEEMFAEHTEGEVVNDESSKEVVDLSKLEENEDWATLVKAAPQLSDDPINCGRASIAEGGPSVIWNGTRRRWRPSQVPSRLREIILTISSACTSIAAGTS